MAVRSDKLSANERGIGPFFSRAWKPFIHIPMMGWLIGALIAVLLEQFFGAPLALMLGISKIPVLFGTVIVLK